MQTHHVGSGCAKSNQFLTECIGRRYLVKCYDYLKLFWGPNDDDVVFMKQTFDKCLKQGLRCDIDMCLYPHCPNNTEKRVRMMPVEKKMMRCGACGIAAYCDKNCQRKDWKNHRDVCKACRDLRDITPVSNFLEGDQLPNYVKYW
jgi:hypothetical protein